MGEQGALPPQIARPFEIIAFDWDGTAVMSRREDASPVRKVLEELLRLGVPVVVITGTNFSNVDRQLSAGIRGPHKRHLYVSTNRGSEVYGFDAASEPTLLWRRVASAEENRVLTEIADAVRDELVARSHLDIRVIYNRMNRRKIDLIPSPEWRDPPKSEIDNLLIAVQQRLQGAGIAGGLREAFDLARKVALEKGLPDARITSDVKHIEIGLTDKSDAVEWIWRELAQSKGVAPEDILFGGDEFGPVAGFEGSDYRMVAQRVKGARFVSVGVEPNGVPPEVIHLGGGPPRFREILERQVALHRQARRGEAAWNAAGHIEDRRRGDERQVREGNATIAESLDLLLAPTADLNWLLLEEGFNLAREHEIESLFALSNGYLGTRGALAEGSSLSSPATFLSGVFDVGARSDAIPELAVAPEWARLRVIVEGQELKLEQGKFLEHRRMLDLRQGILWREWRHEDPTGRVTRLRFMRLTSLADRHTLLQSVTLTPENYSGRVTLEAVIEERLDGGRALATGLEAISLPTTLAAVRGAAVASDAALTLRTAQTGMTVAFAAAGRLRSKNQEIERSVERGEERFVERWDWEADIGESYRLDRVVTIFTSRDSPRPARNAAEHLEQLLDGGLEAIVGAHMKAWEERWRISDVVIQGDEAMQRALRFAIYHLIGAANPEDERVSIGARALTGHVYKGHVFWDTEIYMLPFYVFTYPEAAKALLMFRYHTLPAAREKASARGYRGALYPWEATNSGEESTPTFALAPDGEVIPILSGEMEQHISADIAYAVWQYWQVTGDEEFFVNAGAEIMLETARFWASRGQMEGDGRYHIRHVIGPDEYHEDVDDNACTNVMAQWNMERAVETVRIVKESWPERWAELVERLQLEPSEPEEWHRLATVMYTGFDPETGLFEQFQGYFELDEIDLAAYERRTAPMDVVLGRERIRESKVIKQPDVVMLIHLLWDSLAPLVREVNFRYYEPRCGHGSSLSPSIHALVAARLGDIGMAERYLKQAAEIDLANNMGNAAGGVHAAAAGGLWQALVFGFGGTQARPDGLALAPRLSPRWKSLRFAARWRGRKLEAIIAREPDAVEVGLEGQGPMTVVLPGDVKGKLRPGQRLMAKRDNGKLGDKWKGKWRPWQEVKL